MYPKCLIVWHPGLLYKLKDILPQPYYLFFKSYIENCYFVTKGVWNCLAPIAAGVPQGAIPLLFYLINVNSTDQPTKTLTSTADFADDKLIYSQHKDPITASYNLQYHLDLMFLWYNGKNINHEKSHNLTFTLKQETVQPVTLNCINIPRSSTLDIYA